MIGGPLSSVIRTARRERRNFRPGGSFETAALSDLVALDRVRVDFEHACGVGRCRSMTIRGERRNGEVLITVDGAPLDWRSSLAVRNHSPTRDRRGATAARARPSSLAILLAVTDQATAERFYQRFKWRVLAPIEVDQWSLDAGDVLGWLESAAGTDDFVGLAVET